MATNARWAARSSADSRGSKRFRAHADDYSLTCGGNWRCGLGQNELRLTGTDQFNVNLGQQLGIEQRAVFGAMGVVDRVTDAEIVEPIGATGVLAAGDEQSVDHPLARDKRAARAFQFGVEEA